MVSIDSIFIQTTVSSSLLSVYKIYLNHGNPKTLNTYCAFAYRQGIVNIRHRRYIGRIAMPADLS